MIRVLLVDDSTVARKILSQALTRSDIKVVGEAPDPFAARDRIVELKPDVVVLDVAMPKMDGITFLRRLMRYHPLPVVVCSSWTHEGRELAVAAFDAGAVEVIGKPTPEYPFAQMSRDLIDAVRAAAVSRKLPGSTAARAIELKTRGNVQLVVFGASTGGTIAIETVVRDLPARMPPLLIVQHMPPYITQAFADRLERLSRLQVHEARDGELLEDGVALVAPGGSHMLVQADRGRLIARVRGGPRVNGHRPSVDVLFHSVAEQVGARAVGALLTGMGRDGAEGLLAMRDAGAHTLAQDEATSVVFGMPQAAIELDAADEVAALPEIAERVVRACETQRARVARARLG